MNKSYQGYKEGDKDNRAWGGYVVKKVIYNNDTCTLCEKVITVNPGEILSLQSHKNREERWEVLDGVLTVLLDGTITELKEGQDIFIPKQSIHSMCNLSDKTCSLHETQTGECYEDDIIRYWDVNGRDVIDINNVDVRNFIKVCEALVPKLNKIKMNLCKK